MIYEGDITDAHMHLWDLTNNYPWLTTPVTNLEKMIGDYSDIRKSFLVEDYRKITAGYRINKTVNVEALGFPDSPVDETRWLQQQADDYGLSDAIVAHVKLDLPEVEDLLAANCECKNVRGVRMILNWHDLPYMRSTDRPDYMQDDKWLHGFSLLEKHNLSFDLHIYDHQIPEAAELARTFPNIHIILEHLGWPTAFTDNDFAHWQDHINQIAEHTNVSIKLTSLGLAFQKRLSEDRLNSYIRHAVQAFGTERSMFGSDFPPSSLFYSFNELIHTIDNALSIYSYEDKEKIFSRNANRIYRI